MQKPLIGIAVPAVIIAGGFALLQNGNSGSPASHGTPESRDGRTEYCVEVPVSTPVLEINAGGQKIKVPSKGKPAVCVEWDSKISGTPTITYFNNCGSLCAAVRLEDIDISQDLAMRVTYEDDGKQQSVALNPDPVNVSQAGQEQCIALYDPDKPSPCDILITAPSDLTATPDRRAVSLAWSPSKEANGRKVTLSYEVWRGTSDGPDTFVQVTTTPETGFVDSGLERKTTYWYYVVAVADSGHRSSGSETVSVTTK